MYLAEIPNICGYGIQILSDCEKTAEKLLKKKYYEWRKSDGFPAHINTYDKAIEYFDGGVREIKLNEAYYDGFGY